MKKIFKSALALLMTVLTVAIGMTSVFASSEAQNGWVNQDGNFKYYVNGSPVTGIYKVGNHDYVFDSEGNYVSPYDAHNGVGTTDTMNSTEYINGVASKVQLAGITIDPGKTYRNNYEKLVSTMLGTTYTALTLTEGNSSSVPQLAMPTKSGVTYTFAQRAPANYALVINDGETDGYANLNLTGSNAHSNLYNGGDDIVFEADVALGSDYKKLYSLTLLSVIYRNFNLQNDDDPSTANNPAKTPYVQGLLNMNKDGYVYSSKAGSSVLIAKLTNNEYTRISVALHPQENTYDVYINGIPMLKDLELSKEYPEFIKSAKIDEIRLFQFGGNNTEHEGSVLVDNVYCYLADKPLLCDGYSSETADFNDAVAEKDIYSSITFNTDNKLGTSFSAATAIVGGESITNNTKNHVYGSAGRLQLATKGDGTATLVKRGNGYAVQLKSPSGTEDSYLNLYPNAMPSAQDIIFDIETKLGDDYNTETATEGFTLVQFIYRGVETGGDKFIHLLKVKPNGNVYDNITGNNLFKLTKDYQRISIAFHPIKNSYDVYVDGRLIKSELKFYSDATFAANNQIDEIRMIQFNQKAGSDGCVLADNVYLYSGSTPAYIAKSGLYQEGSYLRHYLNDFIQISSYDLTGTYFGQEFNGEPVSFSAGHAFVGSTLSIKTDGKITSSSPVYDPLVTLPGAVDMKNGKVFAVWKITDSEGHVYSANANEKIMLSSDTTAEALGISLEMLSGASVSTSGNPSLRFMAKISASELKTLTDLGIKVTPHMLIAPSSCFDNTHGYHTVEALLSAGYTTADYIDVTANDWFSQSSSYCYFAGSTNTLSLNDAAKKYSAVAYIELETTSGDKYKLYSDFSDAENTRSLAEVAHEAYNDRVTTPTEGYPYSIQYKGTTTYSSYTQTELDYFKSICDKILLLEADSTGIKQLGAYYTSPYTVSVSSNNGIYTATVTGNVSNVAAILLNGEYLASDEYTKTSSNIVFSFDSGAQKLYSAGTVKSFNKVGSAAVFAVGGYSGLINNVHYVSNPSDKNTTAFKDGDIYYVPANVFAVANDSNARFYTGIKMLEFTYKSKVYKISEAGAAANGTAVTLKYPAKVSGGAVYISAEDAMSIFGYSQLYTDVTGIIVLSNTANILNITSDYSLIEDLVQCCNYVRPTGQQIANDVMSFSGAQHPYIMMTQEKFDDLNFYQKTDPVLKRYIQLLEGSYGTTTSKFKSAPVNYDIYDGQRLLSISRSAMNKIIPWATLYHLYIDENVTLAKQYADRLWDEVEAIYYFTDWNPSHYLDTGEMAYAIAIAYDWLYDYWTAEQRAMMEGMLYGMALKTTSVLGGSYRLDSATNNWNGVCNGGVMAAALALVNVQNDVTWKKINNSTPYHPTVIPTIPKHGETAFTVTELLDGNGTGAPTLTEVTKYTTKAADVRADVMTVLGTSITAIEKGMWVYGPDGGYEEGPGYWSYGTTYAHIFIASLDTACGTNYGIYNTIGFEHSVYFTTYLSANKNTWGFHDGGSGSSDTSIAAWFALKSGDGNINSIRREAIENGWKSVSIYDVLYFNPHILNKTITLELDAHYSLDSIMTFRNTWEQSGSIFAGLHGGSNTASHGDLDVGNFVIAVNGEFLIDELNAEAYMVDGYFGNYRYSYYRKRAEGQNTIVMLPTGQSWNGTTGNPQTGARPTPDQVRASGVKSTTLRYETGINSAIGVVDMSPAYTYMTEGKRGMYIKDNRSTIIVQDEGKFSQAMDIWWFAHTKGNITIPEDGRSAIIERNGLTLYAEIVSSAHPDAVFTEMEAVSLDENYVGDTIPNPDYPDGGYSENDRSAYSKLCIKLTNVSEIKLAVAFSVIGGAVNKPEAGTTYTWSDIDTWTVDSSHSCADNLLNVPVAEPTCLSDGNSEYNQCNICEKYYADSNASNEIAKDSWILKKVAHTPSEAGTTADKDSHSIVCSVCNTFLKNEAHTYKYICSANCYKCGYDRTVNVGVAHLPTGTLKYNDNDLLFGNHHYDTCQFCGIKIDPTEHTFTNYISDNNATLTADGTKTAQCDAGCGKTHTVADEGSKISNDLVFSGLALTLYDDIAANYRVHKSVFESGKYTDIYAKFVLGTSEPVIVTEYMVMGDYYVFRFKDIPAFRMVDDITATLCASYNGEAAEGEAKVMSVRTYCRTVIRQSGTSELLKTLLQNVLNYGAASQKYANYNTSALANSILTNTVANRPNSFDLTTLTNSANVAEFAGAAVTWGSVSISTGNQMRFSINTDSIEGLKVEVSGTNGKTVITDFVYDETISKYVFCFSDITAAQMSEVFKFTVYRNGAQVSPTLSYSVESYAASNAATTDTKLALLLKSMMLYGNSAKEYADSLG